MSRHAVKLSRHNLVLTSFIVISGLGLFAWWFSHLQTLSSLNWKALPPEVPALTPPGNMHLTTDTQAFERPLFWESRRPLTASAPQTDDKPTTSMELLGIVSEREQRIALIRLLQAPPPQSVRRLHIGESYNGMTLQSITNDRVTFEGASGSKTLQLKRGSQKSEPNQQSAELGTPSSAEATPKNSSSTSNARTNQLRDRSMQQVQPAFSLKPQSKNSTR